MQGNAAERNCLLQLRYNKRKVSMPDTLQIYSRALSVSYIDINVSSHILSTSPFTSHTTI
jgi:hypothetical protein